VKTLGAVIVAIGGMTLLGVVFTVRMADLRWLFLGLPFTLMLLLMSRLAPTGYRLAADGLHVVRRGFPDKVIPYRRIRGVDRTPRPLTGLTLTGSKGIFGRFGTFWSPRLGVYRLYMTHTDRVLWLDTADGLVGLSPDAPDELAARLQERLAAAR
jgi:hypothetical protein